MVRATIIALVMLIVAGCSQELGEVDVADPSLILFVSNQSFDDDPIRLTVALDGETVVEDTFRVRNQHTWIEYRLGPTPGTHELTATSATGAEISGTIEIPDSGPLYAVVEYWYYEEDLDREMTLRTQDTPFQFD